MDQIRIIDLLVNVNVGEILALRRRQKTVFLGTSPKSVSPPKPPLHSGLKE